MTKAIVLMTALVPTIGHQFLIEFASNLGCDEVHVILGTLDREPVCGSSRLSAIWNQFEHRQDVIVHYLYDDVPQEPSEHPDFWNVWKKIVEDHVGTVEPNDYFVVSELYGIDMARVLNCKFMPCNRYREVYPVKGTSVRSNLRANFDQIMPSAKHIFSTDVVIFGAESCGKTTMAKALARDMNGTFVPEWAREYLETVGPEVTTEKMRMIVDGQRALSYSMMNNPSKPWNFFDTDLFSTLGYYRLWNDPSVSVEDIYKCTWHAHITVSDLYVVMNDGIPFESDPLRYGGDKRESNMQYWIDLLEEFGLPYYVVPMGTHEEQLEAVKIRLEELYLERFGKIEKYVR